MKPDLRILALTNLFPSAKRPSWGVFIEQQVEGLRQIGAAVEVCYIDRLELGMRAYRDTQSMLERTLRKFRPSLLHIMYGGVMADLATRKNWNVPAVVTFHGSDLLGENQGGWMRKWISAYGVRCSWRAARRAQGIVVVADQLKRALPPTVPRDKVRVIPCGIDLNRFKPTDKDFAQDQLHWRKDRFHVLFPSHRHNAVKRPGLAVEAIKHLNALGVAAELHYLENVPNSVVPLWMSACHALLLTSAQEGSPTVIKEALACELPIVSVDVGDVAERIDGIVGCHLTPAVPETIAAKLRLVSLGPPQLDSRPHVAALSLENTSRALVDFYSELLPGAPAPHPSKPRNLPSEEMTAHAVIR